MTPRCQGNPAGPVTWPSLWWMCAMAVSIVAVALILRSWAGNTRHETLQFLSRPVSGPTRAPLPPLTTRMLSRGGMPPHTTAAGAAVMTPALPPVAVPPTSAWRSIYPTDPTDLLALRSGGAVPDGPWGFTTLYVITVLLGCMGLRCRLPSPAHDRVDPGAASGLLQAVSLASCRSPPQESAAPQGVAGAGPETEPWTVAIMTATGDKPPAAQRSWVPIWVSCPPQS